MIRIALIVALAAAALVAPSRAAARTQATLSYSYDKVWPTVIRFLRIDERLRVTEKDAEAGYVLFELEDDGYTFRGSIELAKVRDQERRNASLIVVHINDRPAYMEQGLIDRLHQKLRRELGDPVDPPPPPEKKKPAPPKKTRPPIVGPVGPDKEGDGEKDTDKPDR